MQLANANIRLSNAKQLFNISKKLPAGMLVSGTSYLMGVFVLSGGTGVLVSDKTYTRPSCEMRCGCLSSTRSSTFPNDQAVKFIVAEPLKTKPFLGFFPLQKIFEAVESLHEKEGVPLITNNKESGAFERVAENFNVSEATVNRNYYAYKDIIERVNRAHLSTPENRKKLISAGIQDFEELLSVLTEEMTDEQKQEVRTETWPVWVDNFIKHYFDS